MKSPPDINLFCSFCNKSYEQVQKLIAGPNVYICDECVNAFADPLSNNPETEIAVKKCSFCGKARSEIGRMIDKKNTRICNECLDISVEIIDYSKDSSYQIS